SVRLTVTAHGGSVRLAHAVWERLVPTGKAATDTSYRARAVTAVRAWFGAPQLGAGEARRSEPVPLPDALGPLVFRVAGADERAGGGDSVQPFRPSCQRGRVRRRKGRWPKGLRRGAYHSFGLVQTRGTPPAGGGGDFLAACAWGWTVGRVGRGVSVPVAVQTA